MGEQFTSLKQILNRASLIPASNTNNYDNGVSLFPWVSCMQTMDSSGNLLYHTVGGNDAYNYIVPMYAFYRGGVVFHLSAGTSYATASGSAMTSVTAWVEGQNQTYGMGTPPDYNNNTGSGLNGSALAPFAGYISTNGAGVSSIEVPYYCRTKCSLVIPDYATTLGGFTPFLEQSQPVTCLNILANGLTKSSSNQIRIYRSFRDDFQLSYFLNTPLVLINQS